MDKLRKYGVIVLFHEWILSFIFFVCKVEIEGEDLVVWKERQHKGWEDTQLLRSPGSQLLRVPCSLFALSLCGGEYHVTEPGVCIEHSLLSAT